MPPSQRQLGTRAAIVTRQVRIPRGCRHARHTTTGDAPMARQLTVAYLGFPGGVLLGEIQPAQRTVRAGMQRRRSWGAEGENCPSNNSSGGAWRGMEGHGGAWRGMEGHGGAWRGMEGHGGAWRGMEGLEGHGGAWLPKFN